MKHVLIGITLGFCAHTSAGTLPALDTELVASGLTGANMVAVVPGDDSRIFIVQQNGIIRVIEDGVLLPTAFLNIDAIVPNESFNGLIGMAFHPDYENNGYFYLHHPLGTATSSNRLSIARYTVSADPNVANAASREEILVLNYPSLPGHHLGGSLNFGPDGYLYIPLGDGGTTGGETAGGARSQSLSSPWGKVLRIDVDGDDFPEDPNRDYAIPQDNPFVGQGGDEAVFARGLRNPYRSAFDALTNDFYIADVGRFAREEVDIIFAGSPGGENFGWNCAEGTICVTNANCDCDDPLTGPVFEYTHSDGCSISGGAIYRGCAIEGLDGHFFFGDWCSERIWSFRYDGASAIEFTEWTSQLVPVGGFGAILSVSAGPGGELYITDGATVRRIIPEGGIIDKNRNGIADSCEPVPGDLDGNDVVDQADRTLFCTALGSSLGDRNYIAAADLNNDDVIDHLDQALFNALLPPCDGDLVNSETFAPPPDGMTDAADLAFLLGEWGIAPSCADFVTSRSFAPPPDGTVDAADLAFLLGAWGACD